MSTIKSALGASLHADGPGEFRCEVCRSRCTRGTSGTEYGHKYGCPDRPEKLPSGGAGGGSYYTPTDASDGPGGGQRA